MKQLVLSDFGQSILNGNTCVYLENSFLKIVNNTLTKSFRISGNSVEYGLYWIDSANHTILVELYSNAGLVSTRTIYLGSDFEELFPNAISNWSSYFFKLHYTSW